MKTAISIPDPIFRAADNLAERLGVSRSELYSNAVAEFLKKNKNIGITEKLNEIYAHEEVDSSLDEELRKIQSRSLDKDGW